MVFTTKTSNYLLSVLNPVEKLKGCRFTLAESSIKRGLQRYFLERRLCEISGNIVSQCKRTQEAFIDTNLISISCIHYWVLKFPWQQFSWLIVYLDTAVCLVVHNKTGFILLYWFIMYSSIILWLKVYNSIFI